MNSRPDQFASLAERIRLLLLDVDGVLTDGSILVDENGREIKRFHAHDGAGIRFWKKAGRFTAILSGRTSKAVEHRAVELGIDHVVQGATDKMHCYKEVLDRFNIQDHQVCFVGDDLMDLPVLRRVGFPVTVADAREELIHAAAYVTRRGGGHGAVRETVELLLKSQRLWDQFAEAPGG